MSRPDDCQRFEELLDGLAAGDRVLSSGEGAFVDGHRARCERCALSASLFDELERAGEDGDPGEASLELQARRIVAEEEWRQQRGGRRRRRLVATLGPATAMLALAGVAAALSVAGVLPWTIQWRGEDAPVTPDPVTQDETLEVRLLTTDAHFEAEVNDQEVIVSVSRGSVRLELPGGGTREVTAGERLEHGTPGTGPQATVPHAADADEERATGGGPSAGTGDMPAVALTEPVPTSGGNAAEPLPSIEDLLLRAREARLDRSWQDAAIAYETLIALHGDTPEAATCRVSLGQLQLEQLDRPDDALVAFRHYLATSEGGPLAEEAAWGAAAALRQLGRDDEERAALGSLLAGHPEGLYSGEARARLRELGGGG